MKIKIIAVGKNKDSNLLEIQDKYLKRCRNWKIEIIEIAEGGKPKIPDNAYVIALDERGENLPTTNLAQKLEQVAANGKEVVFLIGAADGHSEETRKRANLLLSFGKLTWAHMLVRVMLAEQIYRIWSLHNNHPYHRE